MGGRNSPHNRCTPVSEWPSIDAEAWARALRPKDLLEADDGVASRWRQSTRRQIENGYGRWLGWLERSGHLDPLARPGDRATREMVRAYLTMLTDEGLADYTRAGRLQQLGDALRAIHGEEDWRWISRGAGRIYSQAKPARDKAARTQPIEAIISLGDDMMRAADHDGYRTAVERATLFRDGLLVALLIRRPLRMKNLSAIKLGEHLSRRATGWWLSFSADDMKGGPQFECSWPPELTDALERFLCVHRPHMIDPAATTKAANALWVSRNGTGMKSYALAFRITLRTQEAFGIAINPHCFRDIAATTIAECDPENITDAARVLGHRRLATTEKHYIHAQMNVAGQSYQAAITAARMEQ